MYRSFIKPLLDRLTAAITLLIFSPVLLVVGLLLCIYHRGTPFFFQQRPGKQERIFRIVKFKTMSDARDSSGNLLPDDQRLSGFGKFVRSTSLDELPQLFNVLIGQMSLVGPRPLLVEYLPLYNDFHKRRHEVTPGITGWAQVNGRNAITWERKLDLDVYYVDHQSFILDIKILLLTVKKVFIREGINSSGGVTMNRFKGYKS